METTPVVITHIHYPAGLAYACSECGNELARVSYAINISFGGRNYLVGQDTPPVCCGRKRDVPVLFNSPDEACAAIADIVAKYEEDGESEYLKLMEVQSSGSNTLQ